jgi:FkbM family methyltransferase
MPVTYAEVSRAYRLILGREPESQQTIEHYVSADLNTLDLAEALLGSPEYHRRIDPPRGCTQADIEILARHAVSSPPSPGFITDFVGSRTDVSFVTNLAARGGEVEGFPVPGSFHAGTIEWVGTLRAVESAGDEFVVAELGAGWGPWLVASAIAAGRLGKRVLMTGIEADPGHFASMQAHLTNNGFDPVLHRLELAAIGPVDGWAFFPRISSADDWGAAAVYQQSPTPPTHDYRGFPMTYDRVRALSLASVLRDHPVVDLLHIDVQGGEREIVAASTEVLANNVRWIVLGTHSRAIEGAVIELLSEDWTLELEDPCRFVVGQKGRIGPEHSTNDGTQVWRNRSL